MPIYRLKIAVDCDIEADNAGEALDSAVEHFAALCDASDVIDVDKVVASDVQEVPQVEDEYGIVGEVIPVTDEEVEFYEREYLKGPEIEEGDVY